jgi:WD40 repeat protein
VVRHNSPVLSVTFSLDGSSILTGSCNGIIRLWKIMTVEDFLKKELCQPLTEEQKKEYMIKKDF